MSETSWVCMFLAGVLFGVPLLLAFSEYKTKELHKDCIIHAAPANIRECDKL